MPRLHPNYENLPTGPMTDKIENSSLSTIGLLADFSDQILIIIVFLNFIISIFCFLKCVQILSWINPKKREKLLSPAADLSSKMALSELMPSEMNSPETNGADSLLIDRAIKSIKAGFPQSQISQEFDIEEEYLKILHRTYYKKVD